MASIEKRLSGNGKTTYRVLVRMKGHPTQSATFERLTDAKDWAKSTESAIKERRHFKTAESKKHTVAEMIDRYLKWLESNNPRRIQDVRSSFAFWKKELGHLVLADLTKSAIAEKIEKLATSKIRLKNGKDKPLSPARVNRHIAAFSHCCTLATTEWEWLEHHPMAKIKKMKEPRGRVRFLDDAERQRLLASCKESKCPCLYTVVTLALSTGARYNEIMNLKWQDVDLNRRAIILHDTKNKERRVLPLAGHALELITAHNKVRRIDTDLVFPSPSDPKQPYKLRDSWENALVRAEIDNFRFHDLRHSAASYLAMNGASLAEIAEVLGHKTLSMVKRYAHLSEAHTHSVVASMNERIFGNG